MICIYSQNNTEYSKNGDAVLTPISCTLAVTINSSWQLSLEHPYDAEERYKYIKVGAVIRADINCIRELGSVQQRFRIYQVNKGDNSISAIAFPIGMEASYDAPIDNLNIDGTAQQAITALQAYTQKYTLSTDVTKTARASYANTNLITALASSDASSFLRTWGGELLYDNLNLKVRNRLGDNVAGEHRILYGKNLSSVSHELDDSGLITRIYPISIDGIRLNGTGYVDSDRASQYPVRHARYMQAPYNLIDQNAGSNSRTAVQTRTAIAAITNSASTTSHTACDSALDAGIQPEYIKSIRSDIISAVQTMALNGVVSASLYNAVASVIASSMSWLNELEQPEWSWRGDAETGYWYGNDDSYAKNMYVKISKTWSYFGDDGIWQEPRDDKGTWDWYQDSTGKKYGNFNKYFAHNEYVYITMEGTLTCYWFNEEGWYESEYTEESSWTWHGSGTAEDPYWFGEDGAGDNAKKYAHDCWLFIDGVYYFFDSYGYYDGSTKFEDYRWDWVESDERFWFGNAEDKTYGATYLTSQWCKINGDWYYFDANGYAESANNSIARTTAYFTSGMAALATVVSTQKSALYTLLYSLMTEWCQSQYAQGVDLPRLTISIDMVDLSKTTEYAGYENLESVKLGDSVMCEDYKHNISTSDQRVIGLIYDCIRNYNNNVVLGSPALAVSQMLSGSSANNAVAGGFDTSAIEQQLNAQTSAIGALQSGKQDKLTAGENITIVNNVISATGGGGHGLEYWTETSETISRTTNETIYDFSCDAQFLVENGVDITYTSQYYSPRKYTSSGKAVGALGHYYDGDSNPENGFVLFSTDPDAVKVLAELNGLNPQRNEAVAISYNGHTIYTNGQIYNAATNTTIAETSGLIDVGTFDSYSEFVNFVLNNSGLEIHTNLLKQTGIGVGDKVVWGGNRYSASDEYPFYATDEGLIYGKKHISKGTHEGISGDTNFIKTTANEVGTWQNGQGWQRCIVTRVTGTPRKVVMGYSQDTINHPIIVVASLTPLDFEWGFSNNTLYPPYDVQTWESKETYPVTPEGSTFGYNTGSCQYDGATWYVLLIDTTTWSGGTALSASEGLTAFNKNRENNPEAMGLALLEAAQAKSTTTVTMEITAEGDIIKYYTDEKIIIDVDADGNALFKEITTDAGSLTSQMAQKQNLLTAGENIQINGNTISATDTTYEEFDGDSAGLVPAVQSQSGKFLKDDGTWATPSGGGGSANIVELTQAEYDALPSSKLSDDTLYMVYFDGGQTLDPNYNYYKYGQNDEIVVRVYHEGQADQEIRWYFHEYTQVAALIPIPAELGSYWSGANTAKAYTSNTSTVCGWIAITDYLGGRMGIYSPNWGQYLTGPIDAMVVIGGGAEQSTVYSDPYVYIQDSPPFTKIYYNTHEFTHKVTANPTGTATAILSKMEVDGIIYKMGERISYGTTIPTADANDGDLYILLDGNNSKQGEYLYMNNAWVQIEGGTP